MINKHTAKELTHLFSAAIEDANRTLENNWIGPGEYKYIVAEVTFIPLEYSEEKDAMVVCDGSAKVKPNYKNIGNYIDDVRLTTDMNKEL